MKASALRTSPSTADQSRYAQSLGPVFTGFLVANLSPDSTLENPCLNKSFTSVFATVVATTGPSLSDGQRPMPAVHGRPVDASDDGEAAARAASLCRRLRLAVRWRARTTPWRARQIERAQ